MPKPGSDFRFIKAERLCSKKHIDLLFQKGDSRRNGCLRIIWLYTEELLEAPVQVMFSAPKKQFQRAVDRNLLKRRMREAYRLNKHDLIERTKSVNKQLLAAFLFTGKQVVSFNEIEADMKELMLGII